MPDHNTRQSTLEHLEEAVAKLTQSQATLTQDHTTIAQTQTSMNSKMGTKLEHLTALTFQPASPQHSLHHNPIPSPHPYKPHMKLGVPRFDGQDPVGWIFKIFQFFDYQGLPNHECITVASFYMDGLALSWYQWMTRNGFISSWPTLLQALESKFALTFYDDPQGGTIQASTARFSE